MIRSKIAAHAVTCAKKMAFPWALLALLLHLVPGAVNPTHGQGTRKDDIVFNSRGIPLAGATVRVCAMPASGQPCTPLALIYSDAALTQAIANPTTTDGLGNYFFYAAPGKYEIEISGPGITTKQIPNVMLPNDPSSPTFTGAVSAFSLNLTGNLSVTGNTTVLGNLASGTLNLTNQGTPPGAAGAGTVNLYTKTLDKRLYYKDETGTEIGPLSSGGGSPGGSNTQVQVNNSGTLGGSPCLSFPSLTSGPVNVACDPVISGPDPYVDVRKYGLVSQTSVPTTTATINSGSSNATLAAAAGFLNGNGFVLYGAGPANTMTTPTVTPTVTPSQASNFTSTGFTGGNTVAAPGGGSTSFSYQLVADDCNGGLTAASTAGTTSGGFTLGQQSATISSYTRAGTLVTVTTSAAHGLAPGALINIAITAGEQSLQGWFQVAATPTTTTFTFNSGQSTAGGSPASGSPTGTVYYWNVNHLSWSLPGGTMPCRYWVYGRTAGSTVRLGLSELSNVNGFTALTFNDYGSPYNDNFNFPSYIPSSPPVSATNDWLIGTITAGGGTTSVTLSNAASASVTNGTFLFDNATPMAAAVAANCNGAPLYFPSGGNFVFNSTLTLSCTITIQQAGTLTFNEPFILNNHLNTWIGDLNPQSWTGTQNQLIAAANVNCALANPCIYNTPSGPFRIKAIRLAGGAANNNRLMLIDPNANATPIPTGYLEDMTFSTGGSADYMSEGLTIRGGLTNSVSNLQIKRLSLLSGPNQAFNPPAPPTPMARLYAATTQIDQLTTQKRTIALLNPNQIEQTGIAYFSGSNMPGWWITQYSNPLCSQVSLANNQFDTTFFAAAGNFFGTSVSWCGPLLIRNANSNNSANLTGMPFLNVLVEGSIGAVGQNINLTQASGSVISYGAPGIQGAGLGFVGYAMPQPNTPTVALGAHGSCSSNCVAAGTYFYAIMGVDTNGRNSSQSLASSSVTTDGTQTITVNWVPVGGQVITSRGRGTSASNILYTDAMGTGVPGTSYSDLGSLFYSATAIPPTANSSSLSTLGLSTPQVTLTAGGFTDAISGTFTANRMQTVPDVTGYVPVTSYINSAYDNATRANGAIGGNWTVVSGGINIASNNFQGTGASGNSAAFWNVNPFAPDQFAEVTVTSLNATTDFDGPAVRVSTGNWYSCVESTTSLIFQRSVSGSTSNVTTVSVTGNSGDILRIEVQGSTVKCYQNGVLQITQADTNLTSGSPGIELFNNVATLKNWSGGNLHPLAQLDAEQDWTKTQHFTQGVAVGTETFAASPRGEQTVFLPGALTSTWTASTWTLDKAVSVTRVQVQAKTAPSGCTTNATVRLTDGSSPVNLLISAAANDSGPITQNYAAGASLTVAVLTAAAGCTTSPADANVIVQYRMQ
jgi:hypothetical protein